MKRGNGGSREDIFKSLYQRFYKRMIGFFVRSRVSEEDAKDLAQDTFVRFYRAIEEYRGDAEWAYLEEIARHVLYNRVRGQGTKKRGAPTVSIDEESLAERKELTARPDYTKAIEEQHRRERLHAEIAKLPPRQKRCIRYKLLDYSYEQIANVERTTVEAVKSALRDARKELRAKLGDLEGLPEVEQ